MQTGFEGRPCLGVVKACCNRMVKMLKKGVEEKGVEMESNKRDYRWGVMGYRGKREVALVSA